MLHFSTRIQTAIGNLKFYFNQVDAAADDRYHVSVTDRKNLTHIFYVAEREERWAVEGAQRPIDWIVSIEKELGKAIEEHSMEWEGSNIKNSGDTGLE